MATDIDTLSTAESQAHAKSKRGFAKMDPAKQREIASKGGIASHVRGTGHQWSREESREAGRLGGLKSRGGRGRGAKYQP